MKGFKSKIWPFDKIQTEIQKWKNKETDSPRKRVEEREKIEKLNEMNQKEVQNDILKDKEALELVRSYYAIPETQRRRLFELARVLSDVAWRRLTAKTAALSPLWTDGIEGADLARQTQTWPAWNMAGCP